MPPLSASLNFRSPLRRTRSKFTKTPVPRSSSPDSFYAGNRSPSYSTTTLVERQEGLPLRLPLTAREDRELPDLPESAISEQFAAPERLDLGLSFQDASLAESISQYFMASASGSDSEENDTNQVQSNLSIGYPLTVGTACSSALKESGTDSNRSPPPPISPPYRVLPPSPSDRTTLCVSLALH